jgi:hypothetical protein
MAIDSVVGGSNMVFLGGSSGVVTMHFDDSAPVGFSSTVTRSSPINTATVSPTSIQVPNVAAVVGLIARFAQGGAIVSDNEPTTPTPQQGALWLDTR